MTTTNHSTGALSIAAFGETYGVGRSKIYELIAAGDLIARKCGKSTLIDRASAQSWYASLPSYGAAAERWRVRAA